MKNFTSSIRKLFFLSFLFLFSGFFAKALEFDPHDWHLVSQNTTDGYVTIDVERYDGGTEIDHNLYLQVNNEGEWETIWHYRHYTDSDGKNWYSQDYAEWYIDHIDRGRVDVDADGYREYVTRLRIRRSPTGVYNSPVSFRWREEGTVKDNFSFTFYKPKGPGNLQASRGLCNRIELSWDEPSNTRSNGSNSYYIYRDGFYLGSTSSRSYTWNSPADGTEYDFSVRMLTSYNSVTNYGEYSMEVAGNSKPRPEAPTNVIASSDLCDGTIKIDWQWTSETPDNFQIQRSTSSGGGYTTLSSTVPGDRNYYEDTPPAQNTTYYYRVRARNDCGDWGTYSTPASGVAPAAPADPSNVQYSLLGNIVQITWNDNSFNEEKFVVTRTNLNTGVTNEFEVDADTEVHEDDKAQLCIPYEYEIEAVNNCGSSNKVSSGDVILSPDLSNTFPEGSFKTSKGFFPDVVRLEWDNNNRNQINSYYIYRKVYGSNDSTLLATLDGALASYEDEYAENGVVYEYSIKAEGLCDTLSVWSNVIADIGFQNPAGVVSGKITYGSGEPVKGITVTAESSELLETSSMALNGYSSYMEIPHNSSFEIQDAFTFQAYVRMSAIQSSSIFNKGSQYQLDYTGSAFEFSVGGDVLTYSFTMPVDKFVHITAVFDGSSSHLYLDGELVRTKTNVASPASNNSPLVIGRWNGSDYLSGYIDEIRLWKTALDSATISNDFNRYISFRHNDLLGYYRLNENIPIDVFFDISKSDLTFNENHGTLVDCSYSSVVPEKQQLWFRGLTDENGDYLITGIPYLTDGSSFNIVPMLSPHEFNPASKTLFLSDESQVHNNIDFTDISSFKVNGSVVYRNTTLGVEGVYILVDGEMVFGPDNKPEVTNEKGEFEIQVPIGSHYISLRKDGHSFADGGRWPYDPAHPDSIIRHNFNQNLTFGQPFIDTTLVTVVGRVIGGTGSNPIPMGFDQSENNIGKATIMLTHDSFSDMTFKNTKTGFDTVAYTVATEINESGDTTFQDIQHRMNREDNYTYIYTSETSGEFVAKLIPEKFSIVDIDVDNDAFNDVKNFFGTRVIDLSGNLTQKHEVLRDESGNAIDSIPYHLKLNYIYQTPPEISVTNANDSVLFYGEQEMTYVDPSTGNDQTLTVADHFRYPVFQMMKDYSSEISVFESYENFDTGENTYQSIKEAEIRIINDLAIDNQVKTYRLTPDMDGTVVDTFKVGLPNITKSEDDKTSFTKTMQINVTVDGNTFAWEPGGEIYRAYITGQRPKGNNFYTEGPQVPEIILRDPPGTNSSAYIEKGSSYSVSSSFSTDFDNGSGFGAEILLGVEVAAGGGLAGPVIKTDTKNSGKTGLSFSTTVNESGEYVQSYEFSERVETSSDPGMVGSMADIYIGKSYNYFYGETDHLKVVPYDLATDNGIIALDGSELKDTQFTLGIVEGFVMNPDNSDTYFKYTQAHIINKLLPELESRRNNLFLTAKRSDGSLKYETHVPESDLRYGVAHSYDVEVSGGDTIVYGYYRMSDTDSMVSYSFRPEQQTIEDLNNLQNDTIYEVDSIRYYNSQIGIWIDAIRLNEAEKAMAIENNTLERNISFDGGVGSITRRETQTIAYNREESRTKNMHFGAQGSVGFTFNRTGVVATGELSISHSLGVSAGEGFEQSLEYGYTLDDGDAGDYYSLNVYRRPESGIFNANDLQETKMDMPANFDFGILGQGVALVGGAISVAAAASYNAGGGIPIVAGATTMAIAAGLSYIPYVSFKDDVEEVGERFSPGDIRVSSFNISSPIFSTLGGQTMCPYQGLEHTFFYRDAQGDSVVFHKPTLQREKPEITAEPREVYQVPVTDQAFFNIRLSNNTESGDDQWYTVSVDEKTNPNGAAVRIDGATANKTILVPANTTVTKVLSISPTDPSVMEYDSIGIVIHSTCQYDPTDFIPDISDTVYLSASFQPACTNVEILEPLDNWVVNVQDNDTMTVRIGDYNLGHSSFESFRFEYKPTSGSIWIPGKYFVNDPALANKDEVLDTLLINDQSFVAFDWDMTTLKDRAYDIRVVSQCSDGSENESIILSGILDGQRPQVFGTPQPADGILNIDENISVQYNEPIEGGLLNQFNFDVKGTLNYFELKHEAYIRLNGAGDYAAIPEGISFNDKSFTIEFWVRPDDYNNAVILSQGNDPETNLEIGLMEGDKTYFKIGNVVSEASFQFSPAVPSDQWQHMAYVFDYANGDIFIYQNDKIILERRSVSVTYNNSGKIYIGKSSVTGEDYFAGSIHELRIWSKYLSNGDVYANQYTALSGNEVGLYGYWPLDEAFGELAIDKAANRHMEVYAPWEVYPGGSSWDFSGNNCLEFYTGYFSIIPEMDYTLEFWFKDNNPSDTVALFSNQKGDGNESEGLMEKALTVLASPDGKIWVASKGNLFEATSVDYFDNTWHHFALVVRRRGNVTAFIDGEPQNEQENSILGGISGGKMALGARKWDNISGTGSDWYYSGKLDEFRLWNLAKTTTQIRMDMNSKLHGDEIGLQVYLPFEGYYEDNLGVMHQNPTLENFMTDVNATDAEACVGDAYTTDAPNMKDVRPVQSIAYDYVASEDKIIINPKSYLYPQLEKNIIEITVEGVEDKYGNPMASPVTWTAYVHRNQVRWEDERRFFTKEIYKPFEFVSTIKNTGGQQIGFTIANLPPWLTANPSSGVINPESSLPITFTINPALNIGEYDEDIILRTENGFDEKLPLAVRVYKTPPDWEVNPAKFEYTMNMVGRVKIEDVLSTDEYDLVAAFVDDTIRGVANVRYLEEFDSYLVFLNVYGNVNGEELEFRIWDASAGQILDNVKPFDISFVPNGVVGTTIDPVLFEATGLQRQYIPLAKGWNWVSFNKLASSQDNLNSFFASLEPEQNDQIKTHGGGFNTFDMMTGWVVGGIDSIDNRQMYQMKISSNDTIIYSGESLVPEENPIELTAGWNHIGYLSDLAMDVNDALRLYVANPSEIIKSQYAFSMYDPRVGWLGSLDVMKPGLGYMLKVDAPATLTYPNNTVFKGAKIASEASPPLGWKNDLSKYANNLSLIGRLDVSQTPDVTINSEMVLGAFIHNECHGFVAPVMDSGIGYNPFFLNVSSNSGEQRIDFRLFDGMTGKTYRIEETKPFVQDAVYGTTREPVDLTLKEVLTGNGAFGSNSFLRCYPNPFNSQVNVEFSGTGSNVTIDVVSTSGALVKRIYDNYPVSGVNTAVWDGRNGKGGHVSPGIYYIRFVSGGAVETIKISKTR